MTRTERAPAKINLGLEVLGRRDDGYHEIRTILCEIGLVDRLAFDDAARPADEIAMRGAPVNGSPADNLILRALDAMRGCGAAIPPQRVTVEKFIPAAAGLGGASSDAAATLRAFTAELAATGADIRAVAASLGSDVPFFLDGPIARSSGRGEILAPLPAPRDAWVVLATPDLSIPDKTRTMYGAADPAWWSDGTLVGRIADALPDLPAEAPFNVFERALLANFPKAAIARERLLDAGAPFAALTGAGPTFYTLVDTRFEAQRIVDRLDAGGLTVQVARLGASGDA